MHHQRVWHVKPNILVHTACSSHKVFSCEYCYFESRCNIQLIGERNYVTFCDRNKRKIFVKMKTVAAIIKKNVEDYVSDIMDDMLEIEIKLGSTRNFAAKKYVICLSDLEIEKGKIYEDCQVGKKIKMFQDLTHVSELPLIDFIRHLQRVSIKGKANGQAGGPPNIERPRVVQKKKLRKIIVYGTILPIGIPSHISGIFTIQIHDIVFGEANICVPLSLLNLSYKMYVLDIALHNIPHFYKSYLAVGGNMLDVPLMYEPIIHHHLIQKYFTDDTQKTNMGNQDVDKYVSDILSDMLETESKIHKENDDIIPENNYLSDDEHVHEYVEVDIVVARGSVINNHNEKRKYASKGKNGHVVEDVVKDVETLCEHVVSNDEIIFLGCVVNS